MATPKAVVIGSGFAGSLHAKAFSKLRDIELSAVSERFAINGYVDYEKMLARERPDIVSVAIPPLRAFGKVP